MKSPWAVRRVSLLAACLLFGAALATPGAQAAPYDLELSGNLQMAVPISDLRLRVAGGAAPQAEACSADSYLPDSGKSRFSFQEGSETGGCLGVVHNVTVPLGARRITVSFQADRRMQGPTAGTLLGPGALEQEVRLWVDGQALAAIPYFSTASGSQGAQVFNVSFAAPPSQDFAIEWWFANRGEAATVTDRNSERLQAWNATVWDPLIALEGIPLANPGTEDQEGRTGKEAYTARYQADIRVPPEFLAAAAAGRFSMDLRMPASVLLDRLEDTTGRNLGDEDFVTSVSGASRHVTLPASTLAVLGPGPYTVHFQATETLEVTTPMTIVTVVAILLPAVALVLAAVQLRRRLLEPVLDAVDGLEGEIGPA